MWQHLPVLKCKFYGMPQIANCVNRVGRLPLAQFVEVKTSTDIYIYIYIFSALLAWFIKLTCDLIAW